MNISVLEGKLGRRTATRTGSVRTETAEEILDRVAGTLGGVESRYTSASAAHHWAARFRAMMAENRFLPSGRVLNNCGTRQGQLASCFVLPLPDEFAGIFDTLGLAAACHRTGGGTGFDLSALRESGAGISSAEAAGASGPVSWLHLFDTETKVTMQGGKMRGANLASLSVRHPDIFAFLDAKARVGDLSNFNISVSVDDAFMRALAAGEEIALVRPQDGRAVRTVPAAEIWERLAQNAWRTGDPGVLFPDTVNRANPLAGHLGPIRTTNPCGEQTLYPYEASNLGSVNLAAFGRGGHIDWPALEQTVADATRLLDNAIDASRYPDPRITGMAHANRRLGLGVMGFADLLVGLGIPYDSQSTLTLIDELGSRIREVTREASRQLALERGSFPNWEHTGWSRPARNCGITTVAPTGTISMVAGCSAGIEPRFSAVWNKDVLTEDGVTFVDEELLADVRRSTGLAAEDALDLVRTKALADLPLAAGARARYRYAHHISPAWHVRVAARWQRHVDNAVSKTVNLPYSATASDAAEVYRLSWELGCKGTSLYRQGSRDQDLMETRVAAETPGAAEIRGAAEDRVSAEDRGSAEDRFRQSRALLAGRANTVVG
ncbi:adenosylcobalamin-dependent ribonucleoside-diphosphate reductase [Streptomyces dioscori]|uniref:adenosylcobalamin-dependent ribonucleoside-diphosphate reductase n=1 Tax=Streptomyces dioscori TaxID=2109333 RepID=UPI00131DBF34|nr:adenosylcobalamin-dependent ribonucleoside-diphosphate reductase [Streptomyces dioscori]